MALIASGCVLSSNDASPLMLYQLFVATVPAGRQQVRVHEEPAAAAGYDVCRCRCVHC